MTTLSMGANAPISPLDITLTVQTPPSASIDVSALQLYAGGKVRGDDDMCFFNQTSISNGAITLRADGDEQCFGFKLGEVGAEVEKIVINATLDNGSFGAVDALTVSTSCGLNMMVDTAQRTEKALILCEIYKRNNQWKMRNVSQGFNGGLQALAEHFGVEVAEPPQVSPSEPESSPPAAPVDLAKVSLTKQSSTVSLVKDTGKYGRIRINLNWNQNTTSGGFLGLGKQRVDLDLGALVELADGRRGAVQALGNGFGDYDTAPFVKLLGDDRSGSSTDGEWLEINGDTWLSIKRVLVFAFIYDGAANWQETDGIVRVMVPGQPEVEVRMNELDVNQQGTMCAVVLLENKSGQIHVSREVKLFSGHPQMDKAFGWGMQWQQGSK